MGTSWKQVELEISYSVTPKYGPLHPDLTSEIPEEELKHYRLAISELVEMLDRNKNSKDAVAKFFMGFAELGLPQDVFDQQNGLLRRVFELDRNVATVSPLLLDKNLFTFAQKERLNFLANHAIICKLLPEEVTGEALLRAYLFMRDWRRSHKQPRPLPHQGQQVLACLAPLSEDG